MSNPLANDLDQVLVHTQGLWDELRGQRIFITGGTGFFGCWLLESFCWANDRLGLGAQAVVLTRNPAAFRRKARHLADNPAITLQTGDVRSFTFPAGQFSHVIHAATEASTKLNVENPLLMFDMIVEGTWHTLDFAVHCGAKKFLLTSSGAVYGRQPTEMTHIPEDYTGAPDPTDPASAYGEGKRAAEHLCTLYAKQYGLEPKIARCFAFVGPYLSLDSHFAIGNFIRDALAGGPIRVNGDGTPARSYLYASDLAAWLWTTLFQGAPGRPYNLGSEQAMSIREAAEIVADATQPPIPVQLSCQPPHASADASEHYIPITTRIRQELGVKQTVAPADAVERTLRWHHNLQQSNAPVAAANKLETEEPR